MSTISKKRWLAIGIILLLIVALGWLVTTDHPTIWPIRNTVEYHILTWWWARVGQPQPGPPGTLEGTIHDTQGRPIGEAWVLVAQADGTTYSATSTADGQYRISNIPTGSYRPVASAPGYDNVQFGGLFNRVKIEARSTTVADVTLPVEPPQLVPVGRDLWLAEPTTLTCTRPFESKAIRRQVHFKSGDRPNQATFYYTPVTATTTSQLPILMTIYPGPADSWECASLPLAAAGYAILATGPAYTFDLETDIDELEQLLAFGRAGQFPGSDGNQMAILGGSYSSLHVQRLLQRGQEVKAALLLGPPTDLFDMRQRLENGSYIPPFGLDQALIALGLPSREPLRYWRYSGAYHVRSDFPPLAILHSRSDEVVPYQQSELLAANLAQIGATYEVHFFDGASHYLLAENADADTLKIYRITLDFLAKHLQ